MGAWRAARSREPPPTKLLKVRGGGGGRGRAGEGCSDSGGREPGPSEGSGLRRAERRRRGLGTPDPASGWLGGSQAPGDPAALAVRRPRSRRRPGSAPRGRGRRLWLAGRGGRSGEGASPLSPPPSPMSLGGRLGVRATFSPSHPALPAALARSGAGPALAVDVTSKFAALGAPRVAAATAPEAASAVATAADRSRAARLVHAAPRWGPRAAEAAGRAPKGRKARRGSSGSRSGRGTRGTSPRGRERAPRRAGDRGSGGWEAQSPPRSAAHGAQRPRSRTSPHRDRARDARSLSWDSRREAVSARV